jgi:hypothetical protein
MRDNYPLRNRAREEGSNLGEAPELEDIEQEILEENIPEMVDQVPNQNAAGNAQYIDLQHALDNIGGRIEAMRTNQVGADEVMRAINNEMGNMRDFTRNTDQALETIRNQQRQITPMNFIPPQFGGTIKENITKFIARLEQYAQFTAIDNQAKTRMLPMLLNGRARTWHENLDQHVRGDWQAVQAAFITKYGPAALGQLREAELLDREQQHNESIDKYTQDMIQRLEMTEMPQRDQVKCYIKGLQPFSKAYCLERNPLTIDQAETLALRAESLRQLHQREIVDTSVRVHNMLNTKPTQQETGEKATDEPADKGTEFKEIAATLRAIQASITEKKDKLDWVPQAKWRK